MTGCVGLLILIGIAVLIGVLSMKNKNDTNRTAQFYQKHSLALIIDIPATILEVIRVERLTCRRGNLETTGAEAVPLYWCEWSHQSMTTNGNSRQISSDYYFAVAFLSGIVSDEFVQKAMEFTDKSGEAFSQKAKDFFVLNTEKPYRAERLSDGGFIICWRAKSLADDYERAFSWLQENVTLKRKKEDVSEPSETSEMPEISTMKTEIPRFSIEQFLEEMPAEDYNKSRDIINLTDAMIMDYHDTKSHPNMSLKDHADFLGLSLEQVEAASRSIREIEFPLDEFLAKGFQIPELLKYEYQLAYRLNFPSRTLIYLDRARIFLDESAPLKVYVR